MDVANSQDFSGFSTIVYGHHMENGVMFGPITDFSDGSYFLEHRYGNLFANDRDYGLEFFCYLDADAYDRGICRHKFVGDGSVKVIWSCCTSGPDTGVMASMSVATIASSCFSTCTEEGTNARAILIAKVCEEKFKNPYVKIPNFGTGVDAQEGWFGIAWWCWAILGVFTLLLVFLVVARKGRRS